MSFRKVALSVAALLLIYAPAVLADDPVTGKYQGVAKSQASGDIPLTVELKNDKGKITGNIDSPLGSLPITGGTYTEGRVELKFDAGGNEGTVTAELKEGKITGEWSLAGQTGTLELKRAAVVAAEAKSAEPAKDASPAGESKPAEPAKDASPAGEDLISGEWDGSADVSGQPFPFTLKLKLEGEVVSGESSSEQGSATISKGSWKAGKLTIVLDTPNGSITLSGNLAEGKIAGDYDFAGQMQGKWEAKKKN